MSRLRDLLVLDLDHAVGVGTLDMAARDAGIYLAYLAVRHQLRVAQRALDPPTVRVGFHHHAFFMPEESCIPTPITSSVPSGLISPDDGDDLDVPMSRPTIRFFVPCFCLLPSLVPLFCSSSAWLLPRHPADKQQIHCCNVNPHNSLYVARMPGCTDTLTRRRAKRTCACSRPSSSTMPLSKCNCQARRGDRLICTTFLLERCEFDHRTLCTSALPPAAVSAWPMNFGNTCSLAADEYSPMRVHQFGAVPGAPAPPALPGSTSAATENGAATPLCAPRAASRKPCACLPDQR